MPAREHDLTNKCAMSRCFQVLKSLCRKRMPSYLCVYSFIPSQNHSFICLLVYPSIHHTNIWAYLLGTVLNQSDLKVFGPGGGGTVL